MDRVDWFELEHFLFCCAFGIMLCILYAICYCNDLHDELMTFVDLDAEAY